MRAIEEKRRGGDVRVAAAGERFAGWRLTRKERK